MNLEKFYSTDLGINSNVLYNVVSEYKNSTFVDLGVRTGISSEIMLINSNENNNLVFGVDVDFSLLNPEVGSHERYTKITGDSVTVGKNWKSKIQGLFVDTFHIKEQVLTELYFWYQHLEEGGFIIFHDSHWPDGKHDVYGGIVWDRVEEGIKKFFEVDELDFENEFIKMSHFPESWGMTVVRIKKKNEGIAKSLDWNSVFNMRNHLISLFWSRENSQGIQIELEIKI